MATIKYERRCIVCGDTYSYCNHCAADQKKPTWYGIFCSENCKEVYDTTLKYGEGLLSQEEAREVLSELDLSKKMQYHPVIKQRVAEIMGFKDEEIKAEG